MVPLDRPRKFSAALLVSTKHSHVLTLVGQPSVVLQVPQPLCTAQTADPSTYDSKPIDGCLHCRQQQQQQQHACAACAA